MSNLTEKQQKFVDARVHGIAKGQAAILAGFAANSADVTAAKLSKRPDIQAAIRAGKKKAGKPAEARESDDGDKPQLKAHYASPLDFMLDVMNQPRMPAGLRFEAAKQALPYCNPRMGEKGKKESSKDRAKDVTRGRFAPKAPPPTKLHVVK